MNSQEIDRGIEEFELDVGLTYLDAEPIERVKAKPVCVEEYLFLTPGVTAPRRPSSVTWSEAAAAPLCLLTPDMQNWRIIDGIFRSVGAKPVPAVETNSIFNLVSHVERGPMVSDRAAPAARASSAFRRGRGRSSSWSRSRSAPSVW